MNDPSIHRSETPRLVVGVGASAGGLEAFKSLLEALPANSGMTLVLVQHLDPSQDSVLAELLARQTGVPVLPAEQNQELLADRVYVIRPDTSLAVREGLIQLSAPTLHRGVRLPVDHLFRSLAAEYGARATGVVLSGAGSDGCAGLREIKVAGGLTVVQDPRSCSQPGMPRSAIEAGVVDYVLPIPEIPGLLQRFAGLGAARIASGGGKRPALSKEQQVLSDEHLTTLADLLEATIGFDLEVYKKTTVERRMHRRMVLAGYDQVDDYLELLRDSETEQHALVRDLLISVTSFFRNPPAFRALRTSAIDPLVAVAEPGSTLRAWVPGCATGEEAYSIAIEFLEAIAETKKEIGLRIFATDVDQDALAVGRAGHYPTSISEQVSRARLARFFRPARGGSLEVRAALRDAVSFAVHDLTRNPPFSRMDLVSCRNVLIYLRTESQKTVLRTMHFALRPEGHLFLGSSESPMATRELFTAVSEKCSLFRKKGESRPGYALQLDYAVDLERSRDLRDAPRGRGGAAVDHEADDRARRAILEARVPPTLIVGGDGVISYLHGEMRPYLRFPEGDDPRLDLRRVIVPELASRAHGAVYRCRATRENVAATVRAGDGRRVTITATPAPELGDPDTVMLSFEESSAAAVLPAAADTPEQDRLIEQLESELHSTREDLRLTVAELETSNEELRSSNEETMSMNEELQSANVELEATTEELRALNDELTSVNTQLRRKVEELEQANDDLNNFFASTDVATLFLDDELLIKRISPVAAELLALSDEDLGSGAGEVSSELLRHGLREEAAAVLRELTPRSTELAGRDGRWYLRRILPYRTQSRQIQGVIVSLIEVTDLKSATELLALRERQQGMIARIGYQALREPDLDLFMDLVAREVRGTTGVDLCAVLEVQPGSSKLLLRAGVGWEEGEIGSAAVEGGADSQAGYALQTAKPVVVSDLAGDQRFSGSALLERQGVVSGISCVIAGEDRPYGVLSVHTREPREFSREDVDFLESVAGVIGSAISRSMSRRRLAVELAVARVLTEATELETALREVIQDLSEEMGAEVGEVWWREGEGPTLTRRFLHTTLSGFERPVEELFENLPFAPGEGLVGQVLESGKSMWCTDLGDPAVFVRREAVRKLGLVSGLALPIYWAGTVVGVLAVFSRQRMFADEIFLGSLERVGRAIGEFARRASAEERTRASEARKATILDVSPDAIVTIDRSGKIVEFNNSAQRMFELEESKAIGLEMAAAIVPERHREGHRSALDRLGAGGAPSILGKRLEMPALRADGSEFPVELVITSIQDGGEQLYTGFIRDISERKQAEDALREADRQKDEFLAMLGHELRNPLAAIRSATELLRLRDGADADLKQTGEILQRQCGHMSRLLDGLLDVSRIISGRIDLEMERVDLATICREVWSDLSTRHGELELELRHELPDRAVWVEGDRVRLSQVVDNLLTNAVKYTDAGGKVDLRLAAGADEAVLTVSDTGIGIEPELLPHVFEVFRQAEQDLGRSRGGLGLGLALVRSLVELHAGTVEAASKGKGRGARFTVRLPLSRARLVGAADKAQPEASPEHALRVLLIEDHADSAAVLAMLLEKFGHEVAPVDRGRLGIERAVDWRPDVVLCDIGLPDDISGFDVARELRSREETHEIHLIALTGYGRPEDREKCLAAGFDAHLTKPVDLDELKRLFGAIEPRQPESAGA